MIRFLLPLSIALALLFLFYPEIDIRFAQLFYTKEHGFLLTKHGKGLFFYHLVPILLEIVVAILLTLVIVINILKIPISGIGNKEILYLALVLIIGPGLIVNGIFKDHWGRARPSQIIEFGGTQHFTPAFIISDQCAKNCSFVSGHVAMGFYLMAAALLLKRWRRTAMVMVVLLGAAIGLTRIAQGGHFLSDVIFSGIFVSYTAYYLHEWILCQKPSTP